jgi:iron(III) transport system substrate-binding protein
MVISTFFTSLVSCNESPQDRSTEVVVYCSLDRPHSKPILDLFEKETGIRVKALYDTEASKTVGLVNRLIEESRHPQADVFWNS